MQKQVSKIPYSSSIRFALCEHFFNKSMDHLHYFQEKIIFFTISKYIYWKCSAIRQSISIFASNSLCMQCVF